MRVRGRQATARQTVADTLICGEFAGLRWWSRSSSYKRGKTGLLPEWHHVAVCVAVDVRKVPQRSPVFPWSVPNRLQNAVRFHLEFGNGPHGWNRLPLQAATQQALPQFQNPPGTVITPGDKQDIGGWYVDPKLREMDGVVPEFVIQRPRMFTARVVLDMKHGNEAITKSIGADAVRAHGCRPTLLCIHDRVSVTAVAHADPLHQPFIGYRKALRNQPREKTVEVHGLTGRVALLSKESYTGSLRQSKRKRKSLFGQHPPLHVVAQKGQAHGLYPVPLSHLAESLVHAVRLIVQQGAKLVDGQHRVSVQGEQYLLFIVSGRQQGSGLLLSLAGGSCQYVPCRQLGLTARCAGFSGHRPLVFCSRLRSSFRAESCSEFGSIGDACLNGSLSICLRADSAVSERVEVPAGSSLRSLRPPNPLGGHHAGRSTRTRAESTTRCQQK